MIYDERPAPAGLEAAISRVWYLEVPRERPFEKILPQPAMHLIVNLSEPYALYDRSGVATTVGDAFVSGIQSEYLVIASPPVIRQVVVEIRPGGLGAISAVTGADVAGRVVAAAEVLPDAAGLVAELRAAATPAEALERRRRSARPARRGLAARTRSWRALAGLEDEDRAIGDLVALLPASHRTVIARFRRATGLTPRDYAQLWRFHRFVTGLATIEDRATGRASPRSVATTTRRT